MANIYNTSEDQKNHMKNTRPHYFGDVNALVSSVLKSAQDKSLFLSTEGMIGPGIVRTFVDGAIGSGLSLESTPDRRMLGNLSKSTIDKAARTIETHFDLITSEASICDWNQKEVFSEIVRTAVYSGLSTGDFLAGYKVVKNGERYFPALQIIDGRNVKNPNNSLEDKPDLIAGVILKDGKEVGYHVAEYKESLTTEKYKELSRLNKGMLAYDLVKFGKVHPGQMRGRPITLPVGDRILDIKRYSAAELVKAIVQSSIPFFVTVKNESDNTGGEDRKGLLSSIQDSQTDATGETIDDPIHVEAAYVNYMRPGENIEFPESKAPVSQFWEFMEAHIKLIAMDIGIPPTVLLKSFRSNYSASQAEIQDAARGFDIFRKTIVTSFIQHYYDLHVELLVRQGIVNLPGFFSDPLIRRAWCTASWYGPAIMNIDPVKNAKASESLINLGLTSRKIEARKYGNDFEDIVPALSAEQELVKKHGIKLSPALEPDPEPEETTEDDETGGGENA
nr:phage portal protein [uncultured Sphaerochaeta sp.]